MRLALLVTVFVLSNKNLVKSQDELCSDDPERGAKSYPYFGVRTFYDHVRGTLPRSRSHMRGCTPLHIYLVARHGARYPHQGINGKNLKLQKLARILNSTGEATLCSKDIQAIRDWQIWTDKYVDRNQTVYGDEEIFGIARRFKKMLPEIFPGSASPSKYRFRSSDTQRTRKSMQVFANAILGNRSNEANLEVVSSSEDWLILFYKLCTQYSLEVFGSEQRFRSYNRFRSRQLGGTRGRKAFARRLGIPWRKLKNDLLFAIYEVCSYQQWVDTRNGPWCSLFSRDNLKKFEFAEDLKQSALRTSNNEISHKQSCPMAKDIVGTLMRAVEANRTGVDHPMGTFRFGHVTTVLATLKNLGLFQIGDPLRASDWNSDEMHRYRTSRIMPSGSNLAFVLYKCRDGYSIEVYWNEKLVTPPACRDNVEWDGNYFCPFQQFLSHYEDFIEGSPTECNHERICRDQSRMN